MRSAELSSIESLLASQTQAGLHRTGSNFHPFKMSEELFPEPEWLSEEVKTGVSYSLMGLKDSNEMFIPSMDSCILSETSLKF